MHTRTHIHKLHITGHFTELVELCSTITIINPCYPIQTTPFYEKITRNLAYLRSRWGPCAQHGPQRCGFLFTGRTCCWLVSLSPGSKWIYLGILHSVAAAGNTDAWCFTRPCIHSVKSMLTHAPVTISIWLISIQKQTCWVSEGWACLSRLSLRKVQWWCEVIDRLTTSQSHERGRMAPPPARKYNCNWFVSPRRPRPIIQFKHVIWREPVPETREVCVMWLERKNRGFENR